MMLSKMVPPFTMPQIEADESKLVECVNLIIIHVLWVVDLLGFPDTLILWVGDALGLPFALEIWIVLHGCLPFAILLIIPVVRLLGLRVDSALLISPVIRLLVLRIIHRRRLQDLPVLLDAAFVKLLLVDLDTDSVVGLDDQSVQMGGAVTVLLVRQIALFQNVLALVIEDQVSPLVVPALVGAKHDVVDG